MIRVITDFGTINVDPASLSFLNINADIDSMKYEVTFYFKDSNNSLNTSFSTVEEVVKLLKSIELQKPSKIIKK